MADLTGTRLPKVLLPVAGRPFIDFKLASLAAEGAERVVLLVGHGGRLIADHVGTGERYRLGVTCIFDGPVLLGTGGALRRALDQLGDVFWVTYGDTYLRAPMREIEARFWKERSEGLMTVLRNRDRWDRSNVRVDGGVVVEYEKGSSPGTYQHIDYGLAILRKASLEAFPAETPFDVEEVFRRIISRRQMAAFMVTRRFYEIGSPRGHRDTDRFLRRSGEWQRLHSREESGPS
jgi:N-acetyl-alpha-D-muramate 1-phosphate uridylyltransferase